MREVVEVGGEDGLLVMRGDVKATFQPSGRYVLQGIYGKLGDCGGRRS